MKAMWKQCTKCYAAVRNSRTSEAKHEKACLKKQLELAQRTAVAVVAERNRLRDENYQLREKLQEQECTLTTRQRPAELVLG